jgi:hypothetical protein
LYSSYLKVLVYEAVNSEHGKVIKCDFKPGSVKRSIDLYKRGYTLADYIFNCRHQHKSSGHFPVAIKIHRPFFEFDSIKDILKA